MDNPTSQQGTIADRQGLNSQLVLQLLDPSKAQPARAAHEYAQSSAPKRRGPRAAAERAPNSAQSSADADHAAVPATPSSIDLAAQAHPAGVPQSAEEAAEHFKLMLGRLSSSGLTMFDEAEVEPCSRQRGALARHGAALTTTYGRCAITLARLEDILAERR